jgi:C-terminal processing protease CtpA/Prc
MTAVAARLVVAVAVAAVVGAASAAPAQSITVDRQRGFQMLDQVREDLVQHYFDPGFGGVDLDALIDRARQRINTAQSLGEVLGLVAGVCLDLRDSHTKFVPPDRVQDVEYGWSWRYVGDRALVDWVDSGSDARGKGLRLGDTVVEVAGYALTRANHRTISYLLRQLRPQPQLTVIVERDGARRTLTLASRIRKQPKRLDLDNQLDLYVIKMRLAFAEAAAVRPKQEWLAAGVLYWRLPDFQLDHSIVAQIDRLKAARLLVLDLRGNPGGPLDSLSVVAGLFAPPGTPIVTQASRGASFNRQTERKAAVFTGRVAVLVDARSASCAEMLSHFLRSRGAQVVGDATDGLVRGSRTLVHAAGEGDIKVLYGMQVTVHDMLMPDGSRLEGRGIQPDVLSLPAPDDLERGADPVLSKAAATLGVTLDPLRAGRISRP